MQIVVSTGFFPFLLHLHLQKHYSLRKSLVINCTPRKCHGVCNESESSCMVVSCMCGTKCRFKKIMQIVVSTGFFPFLLHLHLQKHYSLRKSLVINCTPRKCHGVCNESESSCMVVSCMCGTKCRVACCCVVSHMCELSITQPLLIADLSLVHTCATRHDMTACDTTGQRTKARRFFSLVPHIPRHDHATRF